MARTVKKTSFPGVLNAAVSPYEAPHAALSRKAASEGFVLLKNEDGLLPISPDMRIALYGTGACETVKGGTGSGDVNERASVSVYEGLKAAGCSIVTEDWLNDCKYQFEQARLLWKEMIIEKGKKMPFFYAYSTTPFHAPAGPAVKPVDADVAIYVLRRNAGEGADRKNAKGDYLLSDAEHRILSDICKNFDKVIVLVNAGGVCDLSFIDEFKSIRSVLVISQPGQEGGHAVCDVLFGKVSPCGKLTASWAFDYSDYPAAATFSSNDGDTLTEKYREGIFVGYRRFDSYDIPVRYCFGYGLSYTDFDISFEGITAAADGSVNASVTVKNTGKCAGREVVQLYVCLPDGKLEKEFRRLCAYRKTALLVPGESETVTLTFGARELSSFDEAECAWVLESGVYGIFIGNSLDASRLCASLILDEGKAIEKTCHICPVKEELIEFSPDAKKLKARRDEVVNAAKALPGVKYDLSAYETVIVDYDLKEPDDEAYAIASSLETEQLISLAVGDPRRSQDTDVEKEVKTAGGDLGAAGASVPGSAGQTSSCAIEQGVASIALADGPAGLRLTQCYYVRDGAIVPVSLGANMEHGFLSDGPTPEGEPHYQFCTAFPVGTLLAQTWDRELIREIGKAVGEEMDFFGVTLWLAPGMNIHRDPLCGRNFEYYSEDPLIAGCVAADMTNGVQSVPGCGTTIKHYACNNQENDRMTSNSVLSERTLREIYLRGFGIAIREAHPMSIMTSYNLINGVHAANNYDTCTKVARCEFGFDGVIMTDWTTTEQGEDCTASGCVRAGNDLTMPGQFSDQDNIRNALNNGTLSRKELVDCASHLIRVVLRSSLYE